MRIAIVTDAWRPQVNGVVRTYENTTAELEAMGHAVRIVSPLGMRSFPCPTYPDIPIAVLPGRTVTRALDAFGPDAVHVATGDVFVFPSLTDTFGVVLLEAMACGLPVAAYPVTGPVDVVRQGETGILDADLGRAVRRVLALDPARCVAHARTRSWRAATETFFSLLEFRRGRLPAPETG